MGATTAGNPKGRAKGRGRNDRSVGSVSCGSCGADSQAGARYCQNCGRSMEKRSFGGFDGQTLAVLGAAGLTLLALGLLFSSVVDTGGGDADPAASVPSRTAQAPAAQAPEGQPPDLSTMTPREAADRLFNRVMMADEQGDVGEVTQFAPMAVAAYDQLEELDLDAIYHVGLIEAAAGNIEQAWEAVERLRAVVPGHLLASTLEYRLALAENDQEKAARAVERFKADYDEEIKVDRLEYRDHRPSIDLFRREIGEVTGGG